MSTRTIGGSAFALVLLAGLGAGTAHAFTAKSIPLDAAGLATATPAAMCGRSCAGGGRYYPGPPEVCAEYGLNFCGPSRPPPPPPPGVGVQIPGTGIGVGVGPGGAGVYVAPPPGSNCRTITIEGDDGSVRRIRRCD